MICFKVKTEKKNMLALDISPHVLKKACIIAGSLNSWIYNTLYFQTDSVRHRPRDFAGEKCNFWACLSEWRRKTNPAGGLDLSEKQIFSVTYSGN